MDTGFRRYDGTFVPIRRADHPGEYIFEEGTKATKVSEYLSSELRVLRLKYICGDDLRKERTLWFRHTRESGYPG